MWCVCVHGVCVCVHGVCVYVFMVCVHVFMVCVCVCTQCEFGRGEICDHSALSCTTMPCYITDYSSLQRVVPPLHVELRPLSHAGYHYPPSHMISRYSLLPPGCSREMYRVTPTLQSMQVLMYTPLQ